MRITWLGHASFKIKSGEKPEKVLYIDPYVERYAPTGLWETLEKADIILISHWHFDHVSLDVVGKLRYDETKIIGTRESAAEIDGCEALTAGEEREIGKVKIRAVPAYTPRRPAHIERGVVIGFLLEIEGKRIYYASDTGIIPEMQTLGKIDIAILPVGGTHTMSPAEAAKVVEILKPKIAIPSHWGRIEGTIDNAELFKELAEGRADTKVIIMKRGETVNI